MNKFEKVSIEEFEKNSKASYDSIKLPKRATVCSAGYDFYATEDISIKPGETLKVATGIKCMLDADKYLALVPRSGLGFKYKLRLCNTVGIVDSDYYNNASNEGHIFIKISNEGNDLVEVKAGDAFAQGIISAYFTTVDDEANETRVGGIGSTSK